MDTTQLASELSNSQ